MISTVQVILFARQPLMLLLSSVCLSSVRYVLRNSCGCCSRKYESRKKAPRLRTMPKPSCWIVVMEGVGA